MLGWWLLDSGCLSVFWWGVECGSFNWLSLIDAVAGKELDIWMVYGVDVELRSI